MRCRYAGTAWVSARGKTDFNSPASPSTTTVLVRSRRSLTSTLLKSDGCKDAFADWPRWLQRENLTSGGAARKLSKLNKIITPGRSSYRFPSLSVDRALRCARRIFWRRRRLPPNESRRNQPPGCRGSGEGVCEVTHCLRLWTPLDCHPNRA